jgi:Leucine-rich repeat (LRR) protein
MIADTLAEIPHHIASLTHLEVFLFDISKMTFPESSICQYGLEGIIKFYSIVLQSFSSPFVLDFKDLQITEIPVRLVLASNCVCIIAREKKLSNSALSGIDESKHLTDLILTDCNIFNLPVEMPRNLFQLQVQNNNLCSLPMDLFQGRIQILIASFNNLIDIPITFSLAPLKVVDLSNNQIRSLAFFGSGLPNLQELNLSNNFIRHLSEGLAQCCELKILNASKNKILDFWFKQPAFSNIEKILLASNQLSVVPAYVADFASLIYLDLRSNEQMRSPPVAICNEGAAMVRAYLQRFRRGASTDTVELQFMKFDYIPVSTFELTNLKILDLSNNKFKDLPSELIVFKVLEKLVLDDNLFELVPVSVKMLTSLKTLSFARNFLTIFEYETLEMLVNIENLCILENSRTLLSPSRFIYKRELNFLMFWHSSLMDVQKSGIFDMSFNRIPMFPSELAAKYHSYSLTSMTQLNLSHTSMNKFDNLFLLLTELKHIDLAKNTIDQWPLGFDKLSKLKTLNIAQNLLTSMPIFFADFDMHFLDVSENLISYVSPAFSCMHPGSASFKTNKNPVANWPTKSDSGLAVEDDELALYFECLRKSESTSEFCFAKKLQGPGNVSLQDVTTTLTRLNISENCTAMDPLVNNLIHLVSIHASKCNILELPSLDNLIHLTCLDVSCNNISKLSVTLLPCKSLIALNFANNSIADVETDVTNQFGNLEYLNLSKNLFTSFPNALHFPRLKILLLSNNCLKVIPIGIASILTLEYLSLAGNEISICHSQSLLNLKNLKRLNLSFNRIIQFPMNLLENTNLRELLLVQKRKICVKMPPQKIISKGRERTFEYIRAFKIVEKTNELERRFLDPVIFECIMESHVKIQNLNLSSVPLSAAKLLSYSKIVASHVGFLCIDKTACECVPALLFEMCTNLSSFSAMETKIEYFPCHAFSCKNLKFLQYSSPNLLTPDAFSHSMGMPTSISHLKEIWNAWTDGEFNISGQSWNRFPHEFEYNWHISLPSPNEEKFKNYFGLFANLMRLNVANNFIFELPQTLFLITSLTMLDVSNNCITALNDSFHCLSLLVQLHIHENPIKVLPFSIGSLLCLNVFSLDVEGFEFPLPEVTRRPPVEIVRYLSFITVAVSSGFLSLANQKLTTLPPSLCLSTPQLTSLNLHDNRLASLPYQLSKLFVLANIDISKNLFTKPSSVLFKLISLERINLDDNLMDFVAWQLFSSLQKLKEITFLNNPLKQYPDELRLGNGGERGIATHLRGLHESHESSALDFAFLGLKSFPNYLLDFSQTLKQLDVRGLSLKVFPVILAAFGRLETLLMDSCEMTQMNPILGTFHKLRMLSMSNNKLRALHASVAKLPALQELILNNNEIVAMACNADSLVALTNLELSFNKLASFDDLLSLPNLRRLTTIRNPCRKVILNSLRKGILDDFSITDLDLSYCELSGIGPHLSKLQRLAKLNLGNNDLQEVPESVSTLTNLTKLYLNNNKITRLEGYFMNLPSIQSLYLAGNQISYIHQDLGHLVGLKMLDLQENELEYVPSSIQDCTCLQILLLTQNCISALHSSVFEIPMMLALRADGNRLTSLPKSLVHMQNLKLLSVSQNNLTSFPDQMTKLTLLRDLIAHTNKFQGVPLDLAQLELQTLDMSSNVLEGMTEMKVTTMTALNFSKNKLGRLDENIGFLVQLITLNVSDNNVEFLPPSLCDLANLQILAAHHNKLKQLPSNMSRLVSLKILILNDNRLENICEGLSCARSLREINLHNNKLKQLPEDFQALDNLTVLTLKNNMLSKAALPPKLIEFGDKFNAGTVKFQVHPGSRFAELHQRRSQLELQTMNSLTKIEKYIEELEKSSKILW